MQKQLTLFLLYCLLFPTSYSLSAQSQTFFENGYKITHYQDKAFEEYFSKGISKEPNGKIWVSSSNWWYQYDGYEFKKWEKQFGFTSDLKIDQQGNYWVSSRGGLTRFTPDENRYSYAQLQIIEKYGLLSLGDIAVDQYDNIWTGCDLGLLHVVNTDSLNFQHLMIPSLATMMQALVNSLTKQGHSLAKLTEVSNGKQLSQEFALENDQAVLLLAQGELEHTPEEYFIGAELVDYAWITDSRGAIVWEMDASQTYNAGKLLQNRLQADIINLKKGEYTLHYTSNDHYAFGDWSFRRNNIPPDLPEWWGIQVFRLDEKERKQVETLIDIFGEEKGLLSDWTQVYQDSEGDIWVYGQSLQKLEVDESGEYSFENYYPWRPATTDQPWTEIYAVTEKDSSSLWISGKKLQKTEFPDW